MSIARSRFLFTIATSLLVLSATPTAAQSLRGEWRTLTTAHFRVHYPAQFEEWVTRAANRLEAGRPRVIAAVGYDMPERVDVVVQDPEASANGSAWPVIGWPRMILWTTPPGPESSIGATRDPLELLTIHETAHLVHLVRPSRNRMRRLLQNIFPVGPLVDAPRWALEGYATVIEGELTGSGRPHSDIRAAILRTWAINGRLPSYAELSSDSRNWQGMSMAYLAGSAYLEWLQKKAGDGSLRKLWARATAGRRRSFDDAFIGVFGFTPENLYGKFSAELTRDAMNLESVRRDVREGELWQDLKWNTEAAAVSPDGTQLATILRSRSGTPRMVVWKTAPDTEAEAKYNEKLRELLLRDLDDVAPIRNKPLARKVVAELPTINGSAPSAPRWTSDGEALLFTRLERDSEGSLHPDLFIWTVKSGDVRRVTRLADIRDADADPAGEKAFAVRNRFGYSELVEVNLRSGEVKSLVRPSVEIVYDMPRVDRSGKQLAYLRHAEGEWQLIVRDLPSGRETRVTIPKGALVAQPAWSNDGSLFATLGERGYFDIWRFDLASSESRRLTQTSTAAFAPSVTADGKAFYFLGLDPEGFDLRFMRLEDGVNSPRSNEALPFVTRGEISYPPANYPVVEASRRPYGIGRQEWLPLLGGGVTPSSNYMEAGVRVGDLLGRLDTVILGGAGTDTGAALMSRLSRLPLDLSLHLFALERKFSDQPECATGGIACVTAERLDAKHTGAEISAGREAVFGAWKIAGAAGLLQQNVRARGGQRQTDERVFARFDGGWEPSRGKLKILSGASLATYRGNDSGDVDSYGMRLGAGYGKNSVVFDWSGDRSDASSPMLLGGVTSSLLPRSAEPGRVIDPALPAGVLIGDRHESLRAALSLAALPVTLFAQRHTMRNASSDQSEIRTAGAELVFDLQPIPLLRIPSLSVTAGAARIFDDPLKGELTFWAATRWRP